MTEHVHEPDWDKADPPLGAVALASAKSVGHAGWVMTGTRIPCATCGAVLSSTADPTHRCPDCPHTEPSRALKKPKHS